MMSSYYETLFNSNQQINFDHTTVLPSLVYSLSPSQFQFDSSFRFYHDMFIRNLVSQYFQVPLLPTPPTPLSFTVPTGVSTISHDKQLQTSSLAEARSQEVSLLNSKARRRLSCQQCSYATNRLNNLKRHVQTMHEILSEPIDCCDQLFISKAHFRAHVNMEHRCGYHCETCRRTFCRKALLRRHQSIHSGQKAFVCSRCAYSTSHKGNLDRHARVHRSRNEHMNLTI